MKIVNPQRLQITVLLAAMLSSAGSGCVTFDNKPGSSPKPGAGVVHQVSTIWDTKIATTNDTANQGAPLPGLAGRVFLFGPDMGVNVRGQGRLTVDLFDVQQPGSDGQPKLLQRWEFDRNSLDRLFRKDIVGWGYTMFLPWPDYQPTTTRVQVQVCYTPEKGTPVFATRSDFTLRNDPPRRTAQTNVPPTLAVPGQRN